jgi:hypothetical protein
MSETRALMENALGTLDSIAGLVTEETAALGRMDLATAHRIGQRKEKLAHQCHTELTQLAKRRQEIREWLEADEAAKLSLVEMAQRLGDAMSRNVYSLQRAENAVRQVVSTIVETTRRAQASAHGYGPAKPSQRRPPPPVTVDRRL